MLELAKMKKKEQDSLLFEVKRNAIKISGYKSYLNKYDTYLLIREKEYPVIEIKSEPISMVFKTVLYSPPFILFISAPVYFRHGYWFLLLFALVFILVVYVASFLIKQHHSEELFERLIQVFHEKTGTPLEISL